MSAVYYVMKTSSASSKLMKLCAISIIHHMDHMLLLIYRNIRKRSEMCTEMQWEINFRILLTTWYITHPLILKQDG